MIFIVIRDIPYNRHHHYSALKEQGYEYFQGFPTTTMEIKWNSFEEYLAALKYKTRKLFKTYLSPLDSEEIEVEAIDDFGEHAERLAYLYEQVSQRADDYQHEKLTASYFQEINRSMPTRSHIVALKRKGEIIAFGLCLEGDEEYFAAHVGIDYQYNNEYNLYFSLYFLSLQEAIKRGKKVLNFGLTTYDFKCRMGCELEPLVYFIKHVKNPNYTPSLADLIDTSIEKPKNRHRPFKDQDISNRIELSEISKAIGKSKKENNLDVFKKVNTYLRANKLKLTELYSFFPPFESVQDPVIKYEGKDVIMMGTNSYLGLNSDPEVIDFTKKAIDKYGTGCSGSPILNGTLDIHQELAGSLAEFMKKDKAVIFSTGYQTNLGVISAILGRDSVAIIDRRNHASLIDGIMLSRAKIKTYRHNDMDSLETALIKSKDKPKLVVTDSVFSMEGTMVNLPEIVRLTKKYNARLLLDEAHSIGVIGPGARGVAEYYGLLDEVDLIMGTFSKSFASVGGFIAGDETTIEGIRHLARSHMFSASLPASAVAAVLGVLNTIKKDPERGHQAIVNARYMAENLQQLGFKASFCNTAIVPVHCGDEVLTLALYKKLFEKGVFVNPVLFPAVPKGGECLRTSYMATHTKEILDKAVAVFADIRTPDFP